MASQVRDQRVRQDRQARPARSVGDGRGSSCVAINDLTDAETLAHLLKYDSVHGKFDADITHDDELDHGQRRQRIAFCSERDPANLPWRELGVDVVIESTGHFRDRRGRIEAPRSRRAQGHDLCARQGPRRHRSSWASTTANTTRASTHHLDRVLHDQLRRADDQGPPRQLRRRQGRHDDDPRLHERPEDPRSPAQGPARARAAAVSMIPTTTGAAKAIASVMPELKGKLDGMAVRVPTPDGSLVDFVVQVEKSTTAEEVNEAFKAAAQRAPLEGYLEYTRRAAGVDRHRRRPPLLHLRQPVDDGHGRRHGQGLRLVRQRGRLRVSHGRHDEARSRASEGDALVTYDKLHITRHRSGRASES